MKRRRRTRENEQNQNTKKEESHDHNENTEGEDRLSDFPDSIVLHILSFLTAKQAVQTCVLSTRWKNLWKYLPTLTLTSNDFKTLKAYTKFVNRILSLRDSSAELNALIFQRPGHVEKQLLKRIVRYALSHKVHRLGLYCQIDHFEPSLFSSNCLRKLNLMYLKKRSYRLYTDNSRGVFPNNLNLPALVQLNLWFLAFSPGDDGVAEPFSGFKSLSSLIIDDCMVLDGKTLCISSTTLVDLALNPTYDSEEYPKIDLYAPNLCTFAFHGPPFRNLSGSNLSSLKHLNIDTCVSSLHHPENDAILLNWLFELAHIESLTVTASTLQVLSSRPYKVEVKFPSFSNLKFLKVKTKPSLSIPDGIVDLLLQNAPLAKACIVNESRPKREV